MNWSRQDLLLLLALLVPALLLGWLTSAFGWCLFFAALIWSALQQREKQHLVRYSRHPLRRPASRLDSWQEIADRMFRSLRHTRRRNRSMAKRLRDLRTINDSLPDAAIVTSSSGNILDLNRAAGELLNLKSTDRDNHLPSLVRQPELLALIRGQAPEGQVEFTSPFDDSIRLEARRIVLDTDTAGERFAAAMILVRDVTQLNRLLSMRQDFIANVSHELRTPLTVIVGYVEALLEDDLDDRTRRELIHKLASPTTRMRALVDDLLLLTRLEASPRPAEDELVWVNVGGLIDSIVTDARALSGGRHQFEVIKSSKSAIFGIETELHSAFQNLLTNAVRYSPDGGPVTVSWEATPTGARFSVRDEGMGIPKEHIARLTERFYRVDLAKSRVRGGTGLGLAIVKHVLKRHDSKLQVTSKLAKGSTFYCDFPSSRLNTQTSSTACNCGSDSPPPSDSPTTTRSNDA